MTTQEFPAQVANGEAELPSATANGEQGSSGSARKARQRSVYLFPAYDFNTALDIARRVEESGGGTLTEETLAINMGLSAKSSGFRLKSLAARQFQLISKHSNTLATTPVAKAILKPTSKEDENRGKREAFLSIPLFQAVSERFSGHPLPDSQTLRNVLEREFSVEHSRVQQAERMLLDSARYAEVLHHSNDGSYILVSDSIAAPADGSRDFVPPPARLTPPHATALYDLGGAQPGQPLPTNTFTFTMEELERLSREEFEEVWRAFGILVLARKRYKSESVLPLDSPEA